MEAACVVLYGRVRFQGVGRERLRVSADGCFSAVGSFLYIYLFSVRGY